VAASLIPFLEMTTRTARLMGSNNAAPGRTYLEVENSVGGHRQWNVPSPSTPVSRVARRGGSVDSVDASRIVVRVNDDETTAGEARRRHLFADQVHAFNQNTCINQRPLVRAGDAIKRGDVLADARSTDLGELALGQNLLVAFMLGTATTSKDSILISERWSRRIASRPSHRGAHLRSRATPSWA